MADEIESNQNAIYRAESPEYGKQTLTTLKKIAAAFDVALIVRFVPFSELIDWVSGTPRQIAGLTSEAISVPTFSQEEQQEIFARESPVRLSDGAERSSEIEPPMRTPEGDDEAFRIPRTDRAIDAAAQHT